MSLDSLLDKVNRQKSEIDVKIRSCLGNILDCNVGKYQFFYQSDSYCSKSELYCPLQSETDKKMKKCNYKELHQEMRRK